MTPALEHALSVHAVRKEAALSCGIFTSDCPWLLPPSPPTGNKNQGISKGTMAYSTRIFLQFVANLRFNRIIKKNTHKIK